MPQRILSLVSVGAEQRAEATAAGGLYLLQWGLGITLKAAGCVVRSVHCPCPSTRHVCKHSHGVLPLFDGVSLMV